MNKKVCKTLQRHALLDRGDTIVIALSGGADSVALTFFLCEIRAEYALRLQAAHVNHGLRGEAADRDEQFVREFCQKMQVPLSVLHADVSREARERRLGEEECGREIRYAYFQRLAGEHGKIATAHTLNDQAETMLFRLARGAGLSGLAGIPYRRDNIIRPLLDCTREEVEAYCARHSLSFVTDETNLDDAYSRNFIRHHMVPAFRQLNPSFLEGVRRMTGQFALDADYFASETERALALCGNSQGLHVPMLSSLSPALRSRVLQTAFFRQTGLHLEEKHIRQLEDLLHQGVRRTMPGNYVAKVYQHHLSFYLENQEEDWCLPLKPEMTLFGENLNAQLLTYKDFMNILKKGKKEFAFSADYGKINGDIFIRARRAGDRIHPAGRQGGKSVKKWMNEQGIPEPERGRLGIVADQDGVIGILGRCTDRRAAVDASTAQVLVIDGGGQRDAGGY